MLKKIIKLKDILRYSKNHSLSMRRKLMLYLLSIILVALFLIIIMIISLGFFFNAKKYVEERLAIQHNITGNEIIEQIDSITAQGIELSNNLSNIINSEYPISSQYRVVLDNNPNELLHLQKSFYPFVNTTLQKSNASGCFAIINATTNTTVPNVDTSRSCIYLRYVNINVTNPTKPYITYYRGIPDTARNNHIEMHNRWELEFNVSILPNYRKKVEENVTNISQSYDWTVKKHLKETWEDAMLLYIPYTNQLGKVYGFCGMELSSLYFSLCYPSVDSNFGSMLTIVAPVRNNKLYVNEGLIGGMNGIYLDKDAVLNIKYGKELNKYYYGDNAYIGIQKLIPISTNEQFFICTLVSMESYNNYIYTNQIKIFIAILIFLVIMIIISSILSQSFVSPIVKKLEEIRLGEIESSSTGFSEFDEIISFMNDNSFTSKLPPHIIALSDRFVQNVKKLDAEERIIFDYYLNKYNIEEISAVSYISMESIEKYNQSIYKKLLVKSLDELLLYIDLFKFCGRIGELYEK